MLKGGKTKEGSNPSTTSKFRQYGGDQYFNWNSYSSFYSCNYCNIGGKEEDKQYKGRTSMVYRKAF